MKKVNSLQYFDKRDQGAYVKTIENVAGKKDTSIFLEGKNIADTAYSQKKAVTTPKSFDILSAHISPEAKPVVKKTIQEYQSLLKGRSINVYGSGAQKLQMAGYLSRKPQDIEINVSSIPKFLEMFKRNADQAGLKLVH